MRGPVNELRPGLHFAISGIVTVTIIVLRSYVKRCNAPPLAAFGRFRAIVSTSVAFKSLLYSSVETIMCPPTTKKDLQNVLLTFSTDPCQIEFFTWKKRD